MICCGNSGEIATAWREEIEMTVLCLRILQVALVYVNYRQPPQSGDTRPRRALAVLIRTGTGRHSHRNRSAGETQCRLVTPGSAHILPSNDQGPVTLSRGPGL